MEAMLQSNAMLSIRGFQEVYSEILKLFVSCSYTLLSLCLYKKENDFKTSFT